MLDQTTASDPAEMVPPGLPRRRWTINGDFLGLPAEGVARYAREVTLAIDRLVGDGDPLARGLEIDIVAPAPGRPPLELRSLPLRILPEYDRPRLPQLWVQGQLPRQVPGGLVSFCNLAPVSVRRHIVCIHDMQTRLAPESYGRLFRLAHRVVLPLLGRRAATITTVSEHSRDQIVALGVAPRDKVVVTYNGSDHALAWDAGRGGLAAATRPYVLCLGRAQRHKNLDLLLALAPLLAAHGIDLWMMGAVAPERVAAGAEAGNLRLLGRVSDDDFRQALDGALCFAFPSRTEGFGLPAVEAMASGCPVVASTAPCLPEVCGDAALFADPDQPAAWLDAILSIQADPLRRARLVDAGFIRAGGFRWLEIGRQYLGLMARTDTTG